MAEDSYRNNSTLAVLWILGLFTGCLVWSVVMYTAMSGRPTSGADAVGVAVGMGGSVFVVTGLGAAVVYGITRRRRTALWAWTILVLLTLVILGIGAARVGRG